MTPDPRRARLEELLGIEATQGLSPAEATELDSLLALFPDVDPDGFELAAAALHLASVGEPDEMPARLAERLHLAAVALTPTSAPRPPRAGYPSRTKWAGWAVAAGLAGVLIYSSFTKRVEPTFAEKRDTLLKDRSAKAATFDETKPGTAATVVWSNVKQEGYFEVRGLPPNDPAKEQYQLWIMDPAQKQPIPVDGGVFDVKPDGIATLAVRSPIHVSEAQAFAISKEKPGGGVKPTMTQVVLVLKPKA